MPADRQTDQCQEVLVQADARVEPELVLNTQTHIRAAAANDAAALATVERELFSKLDMNLNPCVLHRLWLSSCTSLTFCLMASVFA